MCEFRQGLRFNDLLTDLERRYNCSQCCSGNEVETGDLNLIPMSI